MASVFAASCGCHLSCDLCRFVVWYANNTYSTVLGYFLFPSVKPYYIKINLPLLMTMILQYDFRYIIIYMKALFCLFCSECKHCLILKFAFNPLLQRR